MDHTVNERHEDRGASRGLGRLVDRVQQVEALDRIAEPVHRIVGRMPTAVADVLQGRWLGHPVHPFLTDLAIGFWTGAWVLDIAGGERSEPAADALLGLGVLSAVPTIASGWADWARLPRVERRVGVVHALSNATATSLFTASWLARRRGARGRGVVLCHAGAAMATVGGFLGGHLAFPAGRTQDGPTDRPEGGPTEYGHDDGVGGGHAQVAGAPSDNTTLVSVLQGLREEGFTADLQAVGDEGDVRCGSCGTASPADTFTDLTERRLEGASDPDDMMLVVAGRCPACSTGGVLTLSYGPTAGEADAAVVARLP